MRMKGIKKTIFYLIVTALLMVAFYLLGMFVQHVFGTDALIPALFILNIFLISVITPGYWYGVISSDQCADSQPFVYVSLSAF